MNFFIIEILFIALNFIESRHDYFVIKLQKRESFTVVDPVFESNRIGWKRWSAAYYLVVILLAILIGYLYFDDLWLKIFGALALLFNRAIFFELPLNVQLYGLKNIFYVDSSSKINEWLTKKFGKRFGKHLGLARFLFCIVSLVLINILI